MSSFEFGCGRCVRLPPPDLRRGVAVALPLAFQIVPKTIGAGNSASHAVGLIVSDHIPQASAWESTAVHVIVHRRCSVSIRMTSA